MEFQVHQEAVNEFQELPDGDREKVRENVDSRQHRDNSILKQRGTGISYDNHGDPVHYFKAEGEDQEYRVFFDIVNDKIVLLGVRPRDDDTYLNLREYTKRARD